MKICIIISKFPPEYSGPGVRMPKLYSHLKKIMAIDSIKVVCNGIEQTRNEDYRYEGLSITRRSAHGFLLIRIMPNFLRHHVARIVESLQTLCWLSKNTRDADVLHILGNSGGTAAGLLWARLRKIPVMMELVTAKALPRQRFLFIGVKPEERSVIVCLTQKSKEQVQACGYAETSLWLRPNPIDETVFIPAAKDEKSRLRALLTPFSDNDVVVSSVAKIIPQKNQILLIRAMAHLSDRFKLVIAGPFVKDGPLYARDRAYLDSMKEVIAANKLQSRVHLHIGFVSSADYMRASDIYAMPAWDEGFGTPMLEATACGLPVIANKGEAAFCEWVCNDENGYLCDIERTEEWAQAIEKASKFYDNQRSLQSERIRAAAGQTGVYQGYADLLQQLTLKRQ